jgi:hypothetical protein
MLSGPNLIKLFTAIIYKFNKQLGQQGPLFNKKFTPAIYENRNKLGCLSLAPGLTLQH